MTTLLEPSDTLPRPASVVSPLRGAAAGVVSGALALGIGELAGSAVAPVPGPVTAVANRVVDSAPTWFVNFGKDVFGLADKPALMIGTTLISLLFAALFGLAARRQPAGAVLGFVAFGAIGATAIGTDVQGGWGHALWISAVAVIAGIASLRLVLDRSTGGGDRVVDRPSTASPTNPPVGRRSFLGAAGVVGGGAVAAGLGARALRSRSNVEDARAAAADTVRATGSDAAAVVNADVAQVAASEVAATPGITPFVVPADQFYRIDTALLVPQVDPATWGLTIKGLVDREVSYGYDELVARATTVEAVTLSCVSNQIGGSLVGNAVWKGVPLRDLLDEAGVRPEATQIKSTSVDGWDCGFPTEAAYDGRTALVAIAMNDEPLPVLHGFPARLVVSGLYGYVSATKWLSSIELTTWEDFDGYWIPRGWAKEGPIKTQSRIDTPRDGALKPGLVPIAGVAWAPNIGIERVEVRIDRGDWIETTLGESLGANAWRQWVHYWDATPGRHMIEVRATDTTGIPQTEEVTPVAPDGASGLHLIVVEVTEA